MKMRRVDGNDRGASLAEYALLVGLIALVCVAAVRFLGDDNKGSVHGSADRIVSATSG